MKAVELLNETKDFYSEDTSRRAVVSHHDNSRGCYYSTTDGRHCAIGRKLPKELLAELRQQVLSVCNLLEQRPEVDAIFDLPKQFLVWLQDFHDDDRSWDEEGLTPYGENRYAYLLIEATDIDRLGRAEWERLNDN